MFVGYFIKIKIPSLTDSDKTISFYEKIQIALRVILPYSIGGSEYAVWKVIKEADLSNGNDKDKLSKSYAYKLKKLTILLIRATVSLVIVIILLFIHTQR